MKIGKILAVMLSASLIASSIQIPAFADQIPAESGEESSVSAASLYDAEENETVSGEENLQEEEKKLLQQAPDETIPSESIVLTAVTDDGVTVTMKTEATAFAFAKPASPSDAESADQEDSFDIALFELKADAAESAEEEAVDKALEGETKNDNVASRKTYDIYVLYDGEKIEPLPGKKVEVSFTLPEAPSGADEVNVYHHAENGIETIIEEKLDETNETGENTGKTEQKEESIIVTGEVTGFSLYTIDFTYNAKTISIPGESTGNLLADILKEVGIEKKITEAKAFQDAACTKEAENGQVKNEEGDILFTVYEKDDAWYVDGVHAFSTQHGLWVKTEDEAEYKIKVTDSNPIGTAISGDFGEKSLTDSAYYLSGDAKGKITVASGKTVTLDLNGYVLEGSGSGRVIYVAPESSEGAGDAGKLTITDSNTGDLTHYFEYSKTSAWTLCEGTSEEDKNKAIAIDAITDSTTNGTLVKLPGGVITGGNNSGYAGGGVYIEPKATLTMAGGSICGNTAGEGGGLYIPAGTAVKLEDVTVAGNSATKSYGGMLFNANGGGCLTLGGKVRIFGNTCGSKENNLTLWDISGGAPLTVSGTNSLKEGSKILFTVGNSSGYTVAITTDGCNTSTDVNYFFSEADGYAVVYKADTDTAGHLELRANYTIEYELNSGEWKAGYSAPASYTNGVGVSLPTGDHITKEGHTFDGWYDNAEFTGSKISEIGTTETGVKKFFAKWTHVHGNWEYSANGSTLTATCRNSGCTLTDNKVSIAIGAYSKEYDGKAREASITDTDQKWKSAGIDLPKIKYYKNGETAAKSEAPKAAGSYAAKITAGGATASCNFAISPRTLFVKGTTADGKIYDGTTTAVAHIGTISEKVDGDDITVSIKTAEFADKNAGNGREVTISYSLTGTQASNYIVPNVFTTSAVIEKRAITLTSGSATKSYDGKPLTKNEVKDSLKGEADKAGFVDGEGATYTVTGSQTEVGSSENAFTYTLKEGTKADNYDISTVKGTLTVTEKPTPIIITSASDTKVYDGTALTNGGYTFTENVLLSGDVLTAVVTGTITDAGEAANKVSSYKVMRGETDVTSCYTFGTPVEGKLTVTKRAITLTSGSATKAYDGKALIKDEVTDSLTGEADKAGFVTGEGADYTVTGSQTEVGSSANTFSYTMKAGTKAANYTITVSEGVLKVLEADKCIVTFEMNGTGSQVPVQYEVRGQQISRPQDPVADGYSFKGWYIEGMETAWDFLSDTVQEDITLYAKWTEGDHTVRFEGSEISDLCVRHNEIITLPQAQKPGYEFQGWLKNGEEAGKLYAAESSYKVTENVSFTASFAVKKEVAGKVILVSDISNVDTSKAGKGSNETEALIIRQVSEAKLAGDYPIDISSNLKAGTLESYLNETPSADGLLFKLSVELTGVQAKIQESPATTQLTFNVTPIFYAMKSGTAVSSEQVVSNSEIQGSVKFCLTMPTSALAVAEVKHMASDGKTVKDVKYYDVQTTVNEDGVTEKYIEAESGSFSDFVVTFTDTKPQPKTDDDDDDSAASNWWKSTEAGWIVRPGTNDWYFIKNHALVKGWYQDSEDGYWYYLDPVSGKMLTGWVQTGNKWYYLNQKVAKQTWFKGTDGKWHYQKESTTKPYGAMYSNEITPDGYTVDQNGAWDGKVRKQ